MGLFKISYCTCMQCTGIPSLCRSFQHYRFLPMLESCMLCARTNTNIYLSPPIYLSPSICSSGKCFQCKENYLHKTSTVDYLRKTSTVALCIDMSLIKIFYLYLVEHSYVVCNMIIMYKRGIF